MINKKCRLCLQTQSIENFAKNNNMRDKHRNECKQCLKKRYHEEKLKAKNTPDYKICYSCKTTKNSSEFYEKKSNLDGLRPEYIKCTKELRKKYKYTKEEMRFNNILYKFKLTKTEYNNLLDSQEGKCKICKVKSNRNLSVDHCHKSGKIRGLLCNTCNAGLGMFKDCIDLLNNAIIYITESKEK